MKDINILKENDIDVDQAIELLGDMEMYEETLNDFLQDSHNRIKKLKEYKDTDLKNYAIEVHSLKSDSKYLGFTKLANMAMEHQFKSEENDMNYVKSHYQSLMDELERILKVVKNYLD